MKLLFSKKYRKYYTWDQKGDFHCDKGMIKKDVLDKLKSGEPAITNKDVEFRIMDQHFSDKYSKLKRLAQIINPKDAGHIIATVGNDYKRVLDCGAGSGALSIFLAKMNSKAKIFSMDIREDHLEHAKKNVKEFGMKNVEFLLGDIYEGIPKKKLDLVTLDVPEPYRVVKYLKDVCNHGAYIVGYSPCTNQVLDFVNELGDEFFVVKVVEIQERFWEAGGRKIRPASLGAQHSGFLTFVRYL